MLREQVLCPYFLEIEIRSDPGITFYAESEYEIRFFKFDWEVLVLCPIFLYFPKKRQKIKEKISRIHLKKSTFKKRRRNQMWLFGSEIEMYIANF